MKLETIIEKIQTNRTLNAVKTAIIKVAYINIALAACIFVFYQFLRFGSVDTEIHNLLVGVYHLYCIIIGIVFAYIISAQLGGNDTFKFANAFLVGVIGLIFMMNNQLTEFPLLALLFAPIIHLFLDKLDTLKLKSLKLPQAVVDYYNAIMPILVMLVFVLVIVFMFNEGITELARMIPRIASFIASPFMVIATIVAICLFWVLGIHGVAVIGTLLRPFWFYMMIVNGYAVLTLKPIPYIGTETFFQWAVWLGGSGCTLGLTLLLRYNAKSDALKSLGKDTFVSNWFNINENIVFGVPIVDNPYFKIPFFLAPLLCGLVGYLAFALKYVSIPAIVAPWVLPAPLGIFISTLGDWRSLVLIACLILISLIVYYPFFKKYDQSLIEASRH